MTCEGEHRTFYLISVLLLLFFTICGVIYFYFTKFEGTPWYNENTQVPKQEVIRKDMDYGNIKSRKFM